VPFSPFFLSLSNINAARLRRLFYLAAPAAVGAGFGERHDDGEHPCRGAVDLPVSGALQIASTLLSGSEKIVPASAPLYGYADTMNDFNYTGRERMPILASPAAVGALIAKGENGFMLIKDRDLNGSRKSSAIGSLLRRATAARAGT